MKVNLTRNGIGLMTGYLNLDPQIMPGEYPGYDIKMVDCRNLSEVLDNNEADEIIANDVLDFLEANEIEQVISHWASKVRRGGTLTIIGIDIMVVAKGLVFGTIENQQGPAPFSEQIQIANVLLHNNNSALWNFKKVNLSLPLVVSILQNFVGFTVIHRHNDGFKYVVTARRD